MGKWKLNPKFATYLLDQWELKTEKQTIQVLVKVKSDWNSCPSLVGIQSDTDTLGKQLGFLQSSTYTSQIILQYHSQLFLNEKKTYNYANIYTWRFVVSLFITSKTGNNPSVHQLRNSWTNYYISMWRNIIQKLKKNKLSLNPKILTNLQSIMVSERN